MRIREASLSEEDVETIVRQRRAMFSDMGHQNARELETMSERFRGWLRAKMNAGEYVGWFAEESDAGIVAGLGVWLMDWPPHLVGGGRWRANIVNVYTERGYRRRGLARRLLERALRWCEENGIDTVILHASSEGRPLYESLGFAATNEMRLVRAAGEKQC